MSAVERRTYMREYQRGRYAKRRDYSLRKRYGITSEEYDEMLGQQGGGCALCGGTHPSGRPLHVDHDHETGRVRGLLCYPCNQAVGRLVDQPGRLEKLLAYVN